MLLDTFGPRCSKTLGKLRASSVHSLQNLTANPFFLVLAQSLPHLMGQNSTTCTLVANLIVYLESHLLYTLIGAIEGILELTRNH
jgi:hypothetical protein